ncbi:MAG: alpha/beta hydrolase [Anaerolineaceae bacterium]
MAGNMWDDAPTAGTDVELRVLRVGAAPTETEGVLRVLLETTRGEIEGVLHPVEGGTGAIVCVGGAMGGLDGPADGLYGRLAEALEPDGVTVLRLNYRQPNEFQECVADVLAGCSFLKGIGAMDLVLVGHSFGGAVVIKAAEIGSAVVAVASLSPQLFGTREVNHLEKPLLLIHGMVDSVLSHEASEDIYRRAAEPKRIVLYGQAGHSLIQAKDEVLELLRGWIPDRLAGITMHGGRDEFEG